MGKQWQTLFWGAPKSLQIVISAIKLKTLTPWKESDDQPRQHIMVNTEIRLIIFFAAKDRDVKTRLGDDCGSDHELLIAKFRLKLKKVGKTTRPFRYDLNKSLMIIQWK